MTDSTLIIAFEILPLFKEKSLCILKCSCLFCFTPLFASAAGLQAAVLPQFFFFCLVLFLFLNFSCGSSFSVPSNLPCQLLNPPLRHSDSNNGNTGLKATSVSSVNICLPFCIFAGIDGDEWGKFLHTKNKVEFLPSCLQSCLPDCTPVLHIETFEYLITWV